MKYDLVLFDMDGTLVDSKVGIINSIVYALEYFGVRNLDKSALKGLIGMDLRSACRSLGDFGDALVMLKLRRWLRNIVSVLPKKAYMKLMCMRA